MRKQTKARKRLAASLLRYRRKQLAAYRKAKRPGVSRAIQRQRKIEAREAAKKAEAGRAKVRLAA
jgi:hypothetical protein